MIIQTGGPSCFNLIHRNLTWQVKSGEATIGNLRIDLDQDNDERKDDERLDEGQTKNQRELNTIVGAWIAGHSLASRRGDLTLSETAQTGSDGKSNSRGDVAKTTACVTPRRCRLLGHRGKGGKENRHRGHSKTNHISLHSNLSSQISCVLFELMNLCLPESA